MISGFGVRQSGWAPSHRGNVMEIVIKIPEWAADGQLRVLLNGIELVAYKEPGDSPVMVKTVRCTKCGECCMDLGVGHEKADDEGKCKHLVHEDGKWICNAGALRWYGCVADPVGQYDCPIEYKEQK